MTPSGLAVDCDRYFLFLDVVQLLMRASSAKKLRSKATLRKLLSDTSGIGDSIRVFMRSFPTAVLSTRTRLHCLLARRPLFGALRADDNKGHPQPV